MYFSSSEYEARWAAVQREMRARNIECAVVWGRGGGTYERFQDVFYLSGYFSTESGYIPDEYIEGSRARAHAAIVMWVGKEPILVADDPYLEPGSVATHRNCGGPDVIGSVAEVLRTEGIAGKVALVGTDFLSARHYAALQSELPQIAWEAHDDLVRDVRVIKSAAELEAFRHGGETVTNAMNAVFKTLQSGGSEADAAGEAAREVYRREGHINFCLISHGTRTADYLTDNLLRGYGSGTPKPGDLVRFWVYGAMFQGYWLDPGRTTVVGLNPTADQKRLIEACANIVETTRAAIRPGVSTTEIVALAEKLKADFGGIDDQMARRWVCYGHGNGLFWDPPNISPLYKGKHQIFHENMVGSTETFLALPGVGGAGFEQNFIVTRDGTELLTKTPMIWW